MTLPSTIRDRRSLIVLLGFFAACYGVATIGALATTPAIPTWYAALNKPIFNPPDWVFAPVWTTLYGFMALAGWLVWRTVRTGPDSRNRLSGLVLFGIQLLLNALWTPLFFQLHQVLPALIVIVCLGVAIFLTTLQFWKIDRLAAGLMIPYLLWVSFATALNFEIYRLN
jgi:benzodiazapine receptor